MPESYKGVQSDPDFKRVYRRRLQPRIDSRSRPSARYFNDVIVIRASNLTQPEVMEVISQPQVAIIAVNEPLPIDSKKIGYSLKQKVFLLSGALLIVIGIFSTSLSIKQNNTSAQQMKKLAATGNDSSDSPPSEQKPSAPIASYRVAPDLPAVLTIPKIQVTARIKPLGLNNSNQLLAPRNIYDAGWYNASAKPGDDGANGAVVIDGHVHGPTLQGVFYNLKKLAPGDEIQVKRGDGTEFSYIVTGQENVDLNKFDMSSALSSPKPGQPGLTLITCGGDYDKSGHYDQRTLVHAVLSK